MYISYFLVIPFYNPLEIILFTILTILIFSNTDRLIGGNSNNYCLLFIVIFFYYLLKKRYIIAGVTVLITMLFYSKFAHYYDDIYIDSTLARVEIGNSTNYYSSTHRELQIPVSWNNTTITVELNQGSFQAGQEVYLFVINEHFEQ